MSRKPSFSKIVQERPKQKLPSEMVDDLLKVIQNQFYPQSFTSKKGAKQWAQDKNFIKRRVVLWPAGWLNKRGVTLKAERYQQILLDIFQEIKQHGKTEAVKFWPGYLSYCVQSRFRIQGEAIYNEAKNFRNQLENAMFALGGIRAAQPDPISALADSLKVLECKARKKTRKPEGEQLDLL